MIIGLEVKHTKLTDIESMKREIDNLVHVIYEISDDFQKKIDKLSMQLDEMKSDIHMLQG